VPGAGQKPAHTPEVEANRAIAELYNKTTIATHEAPSATRATRSADVAEQAAPGVKLDDMLAALALHAEQPQKWTAAVLAERFKVADVAALASALEHVRPYRVEDDEGGRPCAVVITSKQDSSR